MRKVLEDQRLSLERHRRSRNRKEINVGIRAGTVRKRCSWTCKEQEVAAACRQRKGQLVVPNVDARDEVPDGNARRRV